MFHSVHWGINPHPPKKHHPLFFANPPLKSTHCPSPPLLGNSPLYIIVFHETPLKTWKTAKCTPEKGHSPISQQPPLKIENLGGGVHTMQKGGAYRLLKHQKRLKTVKG